MNSKTHKALKEVAHGIDMAMTAGVVFREQQCLYRAMLAGSLLASKRCTIRFSFQSDTTHCAY